MIIVPVLLNYQFLILTATKKKNQILISSIKNTHFRRNKIEERKHFSALSHWTLCAS